MGIFKNDLKLLKLINNNLGSININDLDLYNFNNIIKGNLSINLFKEFRNLFIFIKDNADISNLNEFGHRLYCDILVSNSINFNTKKNIMDLLINDFKYNINYYNRCKENTIFTLIRNNISNIYNICKLLFEHGININIINTSGSTVLHRYCEYILQDNDYQLLDLLMDNYNLKLNEINNKKYTPFMIICGHQGHNTNLLIHFMEPSLINLKNKNSYTSIIYLCYCNSSIESMKYLIENGADVYIRDKYGKNALDYLKEKNINKYNELVAYLIEKNLYQS